MAESVPIAILDQLAPDCFQYGTLHLVEFEPDSLWIEASLTIAARALRRGARVEYAVRRQAPGEFRSLLGRLGVDISYAQAKGQLRVIDDFSQSSIVVPETQHFSSESWPPHGVFDIKEWKKLGEQQLRKGITEHEKKWLFMCDDWTVLLQYIDEKELLDNHRTAWIPWARARELLVINAGLKGAPSSSMERKVESLYDGVIDFGTRETNGRLESSIRVRKMLGHSFDSAWRRLRLTENGEVIMANGASGGEFGFKTERESKLFDYLVHEFIQDYMAVGVNAADSGWRSLVQATSGSGVPKSSLYGGRRSAGEVLDGLVRRGVVEKKLFPGEPGRGGTVTRIRVAYEKDPVKAYVSERVRTTSKKTRIASRIT